MKPNVSSLLLCAGLTLLPAAARAQGTLTVNPGDLLTAFFQVNETGTGVDGETYVYNMGPASGWRENTSTSSVISNLNTDLVAAFGEAWYDNSRVRWGIVGVVGPTDPLTSGDPARTTYYGRALTSFAPNSAAPLGLSSSQRGNVSTTVKTFSTAMNGQATDSNPKGAIVNSSENSNYASFQVPARTTPFNIAADPNFSFGPGNFGVSGDYTVEAALDVQRILHTTTGADATAGLATENAIVGTGQYIGTFTLDAAGNLRLDSRTTTPPAGYDSWAAANGLTAANRAADFDAEGDGIANGVEFVIGGNPLATGDLAKLPEIVPTPGFVDFVFRRTDASAASNPGVERTADVAGTWTPAVNGQDGVTITTEEDFFGAGIDRITTRIPVTGTRNFARLSVTLP